jgi:hypothetical protein
VSSSLRTRSSLFLCLPRTRVLSARCHCNALALIYWVSRMLVSGVELLNPSSLARDFIIARVLTRFVSSPARSIFNLVVVPRVSKKSQESGEDGTTNVVFTDCATKSSNKSSIAILVYAKSQAVKTLLCWPASSSFLSWIADINRLDNNHIHDSRRSNNFAASPFKSESSSVGSSLTLQL